MYQPVLTRAILTILYNTKPIRPPLHSQPDKFTLLHHRSYIPPYLKQNYRDLMTLALNDNIKIKTEFNINNNIVTKKYKGTNSQT